jgi:hypothetical protein
VAFTAKDMFDSTLEKEETTEDTEDITEDGGLDYTAAQSLPVEEVAMTEPELVTDSIKEVSDDDTTTIEEDDIE